MLSKGVNVFLKFRKQFTSGVEGSKRASTVSTQKALQGSEMETRELLGGIEENSVSPMRGVFTKKKQKK